MRFRTLALALALCCGFTAIGEAKRKPAVHKVKTGSAKPSKVRSFKAGKYKARKQVVKKHVVKK
jgi:hypothetical protein